MAQDTEHNGYIEFRAAQYGGQETSITISDEASIDEVLVAFEAFLLALGYHPDTVSDRLD